jgi:hypothetical protein
MHYVAVFGITAQIIGDNFTESLWKQALVNVFDGAVHIFF